MKFYSNFKRHEREVEEEEEEKTLLSYVLT